MNPIPDEEHYDKLLLIVRPGNEHPIESFTFGLPRRNGLEWIQEFNSDSQILIAPESVETWRGRGDGSDR